MVFHFTRMHPRATRALSKYWCFLTRKSSRTLILIFYPILNLSYFVPRTNVPEEKGERYKRGWTRSKRITVELEEVTMLIFHYRCRRLPVPNCDNRSRDNRRRRPSSGGSRLVVVVVVGGGGGGVVVVVAAPVSTIVTSRRRRRRPSNCISGSGRQWSLESSHDVVVMEVVLLSLLLLPRVRLTIEVHRQLSCDD